MSERLQRLRAVVATDFRLRFRRPSTAVLFLILGGSAYLWIPPASSGSALIVINGQRAIYNSATIGLGTASLGTLFVGLFGFYAISNALRRDLDTRCGLVIASTPLRRFEYLFGKLVGNLAFLATFMAGYAFTSILMLLVRGEAPVELRVFAWQYLLLTPPAIIMVAVLAILFESVPFLSGRLGDVVYFFVWIASTSVAMLTLLDGSPAILRYIDFSGMAFMVDNIQQTLGTSEFSIGASPFDATKPPVVFGGLSLTSGWILPRLTALVLPFALLPIAFARFHRFDPARVSAKPIRRPGLRLGRLPAWLMKLTKAVRLLPPIGRDGNTSLLGAARADAVVGLTMFPGAGLAALAFAVATAVSTIDLMRGTVLPVLVVTLAVLVAGISSREARSGTMSLVLAAPHLQRHFVAWKLLSTLMVSALFVLIPLLRLVAVYPRSALALLVGTVLISASATFLGILTSNPKTFLVSFLSFWYVVVNSGSSFPNLDFAGFHGTATMAVVTAYLTIAIAFTALAVAAYRLRLRRVGR